MKGEKTKKILEWLERADSAFEDLLVIFTAPYGSSYGQIEKLIRENRRSRWVYEKRAEDRVKLSKLIYKLQKEGLVKKEANNKGVFFKKTKIGERKLIFLQKRLSRNLPPPVYAQTKSDSLKIFIFDIPEKLRFKRDWVRRALMRLGFKMLQKSVWVGKVELSKKFIEDLAKFGLDGFVEIFEVTTRGTLRQI